MFLTHFFFIMTLAGSSRIFSISALMILDTVRISTALSGGNTIRQRSEGMIPSLPNLALISCAVKFSMLTGAGAVFEEGALGLLRGLGAIS